MRTHRKRPRACCPARSALEAEARQELEKVLNFCQQNEQSFQEFERSLFALLACLARLLVRLFLTSRHERLDLTPYLSDGVYRLDNAYAQRKLKTAWGEVTYGRAQLRRCKSGPGFYPLDAVLGLTRDHLAPWVMYLVGRLATRMSFAAARLVLKAVLNWSPATETIEQVVLGLGRQAAPFMEQLPAPTDDGEVLVIEVDGKCAPMATPAELSKRRGRRQPRGCPCGCQRHRGKSQRQARGPKKRRKKGDKSKNGKEAVVVVMYTLKRGADGKLHGPINKQVWASFAGRPAAARWARAAATRRGFGPDTPQTVQIVLDGCQGLKDYLQPLFPKAVFTLDVCHVLERLWKVGRRFHKEGSAALKAWVEALKTLLYGGQVAQLLERLRSYRQQVPLHGPGTKERRQALTKLIDYLVPRLDMIRYQEWLEQDMVIATGQVEGAVRHVVGQRLDCSGMRWTQAKAEPLLHLRCIELNGDWERFCAWSHQRSHERLQKRERAKILTSLPVDLKAAA